MVISQEVLGAAEMEKEKRKRKEEISDQVQEDSLGRGIAKRKAAEMEKDKEMADQREEKEAAAADQPEVVQFGKRVRHLISKIRSIPDEANFKEVFLWALLQNLQETVVDDNNHGGAQLAEPSIHIVPHKNNGSLSIIDTSNGMNHDELQSYLCDIPKHAHQKYLRTIKKYNTTSCDVDFSCLISHDPEFSLGFHSAYMVADKIMVTTKKIGGDQYVWRWELESNGSHSCTITRDASSETKLDRGGTKVTLFLNHNHLKYADETILNGLLKKYDKLLTYPVFILVDDDDDALKKTMKEIVDDEKQKEELVPMDIWWDDELRHCVSKYIREREFKLPVPVDDSDDERLPIDPSYEQSENWFETLKYRFGRRERRRENVHYILQYHVGIRPVHVRCVLPGTAIDLDDVVFFEIPWVAVRGIDTICVVTRHQDLSRLIEAHDYSIGYERQSFRFRIWNILIVFVEGILQAYFPDSFWESQPMSANKSPKRLPDFSVASCDEACQTLDKSSKKPSGVFALIGGRNNKDNEMSGADDGEKFAIKFLQQQMARNIAFTCLKTIQTAKAAFQHLFCHKFKDDELRVFVLKNDGSLGRELNREHECMYWKFGGYGFCD